MKIEKLKTVGVEIKNVDITNISSLNLKKIKNLFYENLIVVIRNQEYKNPWYFANLISNISEIKNMLSATWYYNNGNIHDPIPNKNIKNIQPKEWKDDLSTFPVQRVTGKTYKTTNIQTGIFGSGKLDWHTDMSNFKVAQSVALQAVSGVNGTSTSFLDTTKVYDNLSNEIKQRCENKIAKFEYVPEEWAAGMPEDQLKVMLKLHLNKVGSREYTFPLVNYNQCKTKKGFYFHFNNKIQIPEDPDLIQIILENCMQEKNIYQHWWQPGDIVLMDQLLVLHKRDQDGQHILNERVLHRYSF